MSPATPEGGSAARRLRLQAPPWQAPLQIVPGVPTLVLTGGWEPLYEEIAGYLRETGALHRIAAGGHRPHDSPEGDRFIRSFIAEVSRRQQPRASWKTRPLLLSNVPGPRPFGPQWPAGRGLVNAG